jgi:hypothetical protein
MAEVYIAGERAISTISTMTTLPLLSPNHSSMSSKTRQCDVREIHVAGENRHAQSQEPGRSANRDRADSGVPAIMIESLFDLRYENHLSCLPQNEV